MPGFQHDCSEFLKYLLDQLHEQETNFLKGSADAPGSPGKEKKKKASKKEAEKPRRTLIENKFGGKMTTTVRCLNCGQESKKEEMFMDLPLAFPEYNASYVGQKSLAGGDSRMSSSAQSSQKHSVPTIPPSEDRNCLHLNDLLKHFLQSEKLSGDNKYFCDNCGGLQEGERKIRLIETPEYLILTLLRFSYDARLQSRSKVFREVKYPKTLLVPVNDEIDENGRRQRRDSFRSVVASQLEDCGVGMNVDCADVYSLCSVVIHSGTSSDCGHYYCYARHTDASTLDILKENSADTKSHEDDIDFLEDKWYLFNDSRVSYASYSSFCNVSQRFTKDTAYVLIYKKMTEDQLQSSVNTGTLRLKQSFKLDAPTLRADLRAAVVKDNKSFLQVGKLFKSQQPVKISVSVSYLNLDAQSCFKLF